MEGDGFRGMIESLPDEYLRAGCAVVSHHACSLVDLRLADACTSRIPGQVVRCRMHVVAGGVASQAVLTAASEDDCQRSDGEWRMLTELV